MIAQLYHADAKTMQGWYLREALFTFRVAVWSFANPVLLLLLLRKIITFYRKDLRCVTGPVRLGSLTHDFEAGPKVTRL